jgi:hypothetical protein
VVVKGGENGIEQRDGLIGIAYQTAHRVNPGEPA